MIRLLCAFLAAIFCSIASGQYAPGAKPHAPTPNTAMLTRIYTNPRTIPFQHRVGANQILIEHCNNTTGECPGALLPYDHSGDSQSVNGGAWRTGCRVSHLGYDDPIVYPHIAGASHLHVFFGNITTGPDSDLMTFATVGASTCAGGNINRTGYWTPPWVYHCPAGSTDGCDRARDGEVQVPSQSSFYYKADSAPDPTERAKVEWFPVGHRMIIGDPSGTDYQRAAGISCLGPVGTLMADTNTIPTPEQITNSCTELRVIIPFSTCWDGLTLGGGPHHNEHMGGDGKSSNSPGAGFYDYCPPEFPHRFPTMSMVIITPVSSIADMQYWRLASDYPKSSGYPAGSTMHADRVEGFSIANDPLGVGLPGTIKEILLAKCEKVPVDCHDNLLGDVLGNGIFWYLADPAGARGDIPSP